MACDPEVLLEGAKCLRCLDASQQGAVEVYLLAEIAGITPDPGALLESAKAFQSLSVSQLRSYQAYLICQIYNPTL